VVLQLPIDDTCPQAFPGFGLFALPQKQFGPQIKYFGSHAGVIIIRSLRRSLGAFKHAFGVIPELKLYQRVRQIQATGRIEIPVDSRRIGKMIVAISIVDGIRNYSQTLPPPFFPPISLFITDRQ